MLQLPAEIHNKAFPNQSWCPGKRSKGENVPSEPCHSPAPVTPALTRLQSAPQQLPLTRHQALALQAPLSASNFSSVLRTQAGPGSTAFLKVRMPFPSICEPPEVRVSQTKIPIRESRRPLKQEDNPPSNTSPFTFLL